MIFDIIRVATSQRTKTSPNPDAPQGMIALRDQLDGMLQHIRQSRHIKPATASMLCPCCQGSHGPGLTQRLGARNHPCAGAFRHCTGSGSQVPGKALEEVPTGERMRFAWKTKRHRRSGVSGGDILQGLWTPFSYVVGAQPLGIARHCPAFPHCSACVIVHGLANDRGPQ